MQNFATKCLFFFAHTFHNRPKSSTFALAMKIADYIRNIFGSANHVLTFRNGAYLPGLELTRHKFGETIYLNIVELLTSLYAEVIWTSANTTPKYIAWKNWADRNGQRILTQLLFGPSGFAVIGYDMMVEAGVEQWRFYELPSEKWRIVTDREAVRVECLDPTQRYYVIKSPAMEAVGRSEHDLCDGYVKMLDAVLNGATTTAERLGAYVVMSPKSDNFGGVLIDKDKDELEKELQKEYGMLSRQKQIMVMSRPMDSAIVSLAAVDLRMKEKVNTAVLAIADRIKVPANQIALVDANASKSLSNGTELREGDLSKYRSFRRLLNSTLFDMATEIGLKVNYTIENEPKSVQGQNIENA